MRTLPELVDFIKKEARMRNTSVPKIEVAIGWGNGTIGKWSKAKGYPSLDKLQKVADYLSMSVAELTGDEDIKNPPSNAPMGLPDSIKEKTFSEKKMELVDRVMRMENVEDLEATLAFLLGRNKERE